MRMVMDVIQIDCSQLLAFIVCLCSSFYFCYIDLYIQTDGYKSPAANGMLRFSCQHINSVNNVRNGFVELNKRWTHLKMNVRRNSYFPIEFKFSNIFLKFANNFIHSS